jgi:23S rRNA G2445 N2-methylase RlmL
MSTKNELGRTVKKEMLGLAHSAVIQFPPGFRDLAMQEACKIANTLHTPKKFKTEIVIADGEIHVKNISFDNLVELTTRTRVAWDIRMEVFRKRCPNFSVLKAALEGVNWEHTILPGTHVSVKCETKASDHENAREIKEAAEKVFVAKNFVLADSEEKKKLSANFVPIFISLVRNVLHIEVSLAGHPLYMRGYRAASSALAPLREDIAAACVQQTLLWATPEKRIQTIYAPFAGSGTLGFEAYMATCEISGVAFERHYGFENFTAHREASFAWLKKKLTSEKPAEFSRPCIVFIERHKESFAELVANKKHFGRFLNGNAFEESTQCLLADVFEPNSTAPLAKAQNTFVAINPPFGIRMGKGMASVPNFYNRIGAHLCSISEHLAQKDASLCGFVLCPTEESWSALLRGLGPMEHKTTHFMLGGRDIRLCMFKTKKLRHPLG